MCCRPLRLAAILASVLATPAYGWEKQWQEPPAVEDSCLTYDARYSEAPLFRIAATSKGEKAYFFSRKIACTQGSSCAARMKAYLVDGDVVFGGPEDKNFRCAYYGTAKGKIVAGFVSADNLAPFAEDEDLTQDFLVGTWSSDGNPTILITATGEKEVRAEGQAWWRGLAGSYHTGEFDAVASPAGKEITFSDGDGEYSCKVDLLRRGPYLVAKDNGYCGGMSVFPASS
jgi:hypothetical protein